MANATPTCSAGPADVGDAFWHLNPAHLAQQVAAARKCFISSPGQHRLAERGGEHDEQLVAVVGNVVTLSGTAGVRAEQQEVEIVL